MIIERIQFDKITCKFEKFSDPEIYYKAYLYVQFDNSLRIYGNNNNNKLHQLFGDEGHGSIVGVKTKLIKLTPEVIELESYCAVKNPEIKKDKLVKTIIIAEFNIY